jgi:sulfur carrier protein
MEIQVNGEPRKVPEDMVLTDLIAGMGLGDKRVAVEINLEIVPRSEHGARQLHAGDRVEIVAAIGGG